LRGIFFELVGGQGREGGREFVWERGWEIGLGRGRKSERKGESEWVIDRRYRERGKEGLCVGERVRVRSIKRVEWRRRESGERENNIRGI
jgi:hypothetical protein